MDVQLKSDYLRKQKNFSKAVRSCKRRYRRDRSNRLLQEQKKDSRKFWDFIKSLDGEEKGCLPDTVTGANGECISEPKAVREEWMGYFRKLLNPIVAPGSDMRIEDAIRQSHRPDLNPLERNEEITI